MARAKGGLREKRDPDSPLLGLQAVQGRGATQVIEYRFAEGDGGRFPGLAAELVRLSVDVIVAWGTPGTLAALKATSSIPIVMSAGDPVGAGLVASLARSGGNVTGLSSQTAGGEEKRL